MRTPTLSPLPRSSLVASSTRPLTLGSLLVRVVTQDLLAVSPLDLLGGCAPAVLLEEDDDISEDEDPMMLAREAKDWKVSNITFILLGYFLTLLGLEALVLRESTVVTRLNGH
jgi:hypothetical protein